MVLMVFGYFISRPFYRTTERTIPDQIIQISDRSISHTSVELLQQLLLLRLTHSVLIDISRNIPTTALLNLVTDLYSYW